MTKLLVIVVILFFMVGILFMFSPNIQKLIFPPKEPAVYQQSSTVNQPISTTTTAPLATSDEDIDGDITSLDSDLAELENGNNSYDKELQGL